MLDLNDPLIQIKITSAVCSSVAIGTTTFRLWIRRGRLWWDDGSALFSLLALFCQVAAVFMHVPNPSDLSKVNRVAAYYLMATSFYAIIWSARLAILFSIIRLDPSPTRRRRLLVVAALFFTVAVVLIVQLFWVCEPEPGWKDTRSPQCKLNKQVAICQLVSDIISDALLMAAPLKLLQGLQDKGLRRRLVLIFSTCIVTTIVSLVHAAYILTGGGIKVIIAAIVEDCISLIVCNLPVVVAATVDLRERDTNYSDPSHKGSGRSTFLNFASNPHTKKTIPESKITTLNLTSLAGSRTTKNSSDDKFIEDFRTKDDLEATLT